eukprot:m.41567 g.41567  ORF g.41567 m.41567 type:complete len:472 (-) comp14942_c0_seq2:352-1767(-)
MALSTLRTLVRVRVHSSQGVHCGFRKATCALRPAQFMSTTADSTQSGVSPHRRTVSYPQQGYTYTMQPSAISPPINESTAETAATLKESKGPEPAYQHETGRHLSFTSSEPFQCQILDNPNAGILSEITVAYETWGELNESRDNAILLHTGLSASSHAKSNDLDPNQGWWEKFIGPGRALDTDKYFVICTNVLGGCYGSTGPSSINPDTGERYALTFPVVTVSDMVRAQFLLLDNLGIQALHASVGSSMGGMQSLAAAAMYPSRVKRAISISAAARSHPTAIALRYMQRRILMADPHWNGGNYYDGEFPVMGLKHAREIATISYRSGPEWEQRFGRRKASIQAPSFRPDFLIETYLEYQGNQWIGKYDPNSLIYISKAMDLFDMGEGHLSLAHGTAQVRCPTLVIGVQSDILFPITQQREVVDLIKQGGNEEVSYYELNAMYGHDTFLIDVPGISNAIKGHRSVFAVEKSR